MKKILIVWIIVAIILVTGLTFIGINLKKQNAPYREIENNLELAAQGYYGFYINEIPESKGVITMDKLIVSTFYKGEKKSCDGYVVVEKKLASYNYDAYIKCTEYETNDYDEDILKSNTNQCNEGC